MKIPLFYKPYTSKASSLLIIALFVVSSPSIASANTLTDMADWLLGTDASAATTASETGSISNSSTMDLYNSESSINPDRKNSETVNENDKVIIQEDALVYSEGLFIPDAKFEKSTLSDEISVYTVESGDTISGIADMFNVSENTIRWENNITGKTINVGQKLNILPVTGVKHIVKSGDTISKIADKYDAEVEDISIFNDISNGDSLKKGDIIFVPNGIIKAVVVVKTTKPSDSSNIVVSNTKIQSGYYLRPVPGIVTSPYGSRRRGFHPGVDIGNVRGTPVSAAANGIVTKVITGCVEGRKSCGGRYGNFIEIEHPNGTSTRYAHLSKVLVSVGQAVTTGSQIAAMGNTGSSTGPHLHFEIVNSNGSRMRPSF